jgi:hypothetical protein
MKRSLLLCLFIFNTFSASGQEILTIDSNGNKLKGYYLSLDVTHKWIKGHHVNWETGEPDKPDLEKNRKTHCSKFVASGCKKLGIYILRPPEHKASLLANAQYDWLLSESGAEQGWTKIENRDAEATWIEAQQKADRGFVVIAVWRNNDPAKPGHIAFVRPANLDINQIKVTGPALIQAGNFNSDSTSLSLGFKKHIKSWPENSISFFYNKKLVK